MGADTEDFLRRLDSEAEWHWRTQRLYRAVKLAMMVLVAAAGVLTASAGITANSTAWYAQSAALTIWGLVAAIGAAVDQGINPGRLAEDHLQRKITLRAIENAVRFKGLSLSRATDIWNRARIDPDAALQELCGREPD